MYFVSVIHVTVVFSYFVPFALGSDLKEEDNLQVRPLELSLSNVVENIHRVVFLVKLQGLKGLCAVLYKLLHVLAGG